MLEFIFMVYHHNLSLPIYFAGLALILTVVSFGRGFGWWEFTLSGMQAEGWRVATIFWPISAIFLSFLTLFYWGPAYLGAKAKKLHWKMKRR